MTKKRVLLTCASAIGLLAVVLFLLGVSHQPVQAASGTLCVTPSGSGCDPATCGGSCYTSVQAAVDAAVSGDEIRVAAGNYSGVQARGGMTQTVYISKTVTLRGGYNSSLTAWAPAIYTTTLDAQGQGRVVSIKGIDTNPTLEGFVITGGNANGVTLNCPAFLGGSDGCGGGIFVVSGAPTIVNNIVTHNVAGTSTGGKSADGGGLCLVYSSGAVIRSNLIISNTASLGARGAGGGIALAYPYNVVVESNRVIDNIATMHDTLAGNGGGIVIDGSGSSVTILDNLVEGNRTNGSGSGSGAGIFQWYGSNHMQSNRVLRNTGSQAVYLGFSNARFDSNQVLDNNTSIGVGVVNGSHAGATLVNNVIARSGGKTLALSAFSNAPLTITLIHNTLIGSSAGYGVYVETGYVNLAVTNTIVTSHTWGITNTVPASSSVTADHTLLWGVTHDGITGTNPVFGDPDFINPTNGDYHLNYNSAAIDAGVMTTETVDIDGDHRPMGAAPDIGADEARWTTIFLPGILRN